MKKKRKCKREKRKAMTPKKVEKKGWGEKRKTKRTKRRRTRRRERENPPEVLSW